MTALICISEIYYCTTLHGTVFIPLSQSITVYRIGHCLSYHELIFSHLSWHHICPYLVFVLESVYAERLPGVVRNEWITSWLRNMPTYCCETMVIALTTDWFVLLPYDCFYLDHGSVLLFLLHLIGQISRWFYQVLFILYVNLEMNIFIHSCTYM